MLGEGKSPGSGCGWTRFDALNCLDKNQLVSLLNDASAFRSRVLHQKVQSS